MSAALIDGTGQPVSVEVRVAPSSVGGFAVTGYRPDAFRELRDRVRAALIAGGLAWPDGEIHVTTSPLVGRSRCRAVLDLPIAMGLLAVDGQIPTDRVTGRVFVGELGLDGTIRPIQRIVEVVGSLRGCEVVVPVGSLVEARAAALGGGVVVRASYSLTTLLAALDAERAPPATVAGNSALVRPRFGRPGDRYVSRAGGTVFEALGDGRYAVVDGPHGVPSQLLLGTVVNAGAPLDSWALMPRPEMDRVGDGGAFVRPSAQSRGPVLPYLRRAGEGPTPPGWVVEPAGRWGGDETEVVYNPRRHDVAFTWQTRAAGGSAAVLEATGWERRAVDGPRALWTRDRLAAARSALDRHDQTVAAETDIARQVYTGRPSDASELPGL